MWDEHSYALPCGQPQGLPQGQPHMSQPQQMAMNVDGDYHTVNLTGEVDSLPDPEPVVASSTAPHPPPPPAAQPCHTKILLEFCKMQNFA